jgi:hypothetical protein
MFLQKEIVPLRPRMMLIYDNIKNDIVKDNLTKTLTKNSFISITAVCFSKLMNNHIFIDLLSE